VPQPRLPAHVHIDGVSSHLGSPKKGIRPDHREAGVKKVWVEEPLNPGVVRAGSASE
jgi:hypothetical protein